MLRAREVALHLGGVPRMNTFSKLYLALLGLYSVGIRADDPLRGAAASANGST